LKLLLPKSGPLLFDLKHDLSEANNLADANPDKVERLKNRMKELDGEITEHARPVWRKPK